MRHAAAVLLALMLGTAPAGAQAPPPQTAVPADATRAQGMAADGPTGREDAEGTTGAAPDAIADLAGGTGAPAVPEADPGSAAETGAAMLPGGIESLVQVPDAPGAVLVLDPDRLYAESAWGRRAEAEIEAAARAIEAENIRLEAVLTGEEQALTAERGSLTPEAFREKADAFDARAQTVRAERAQAARDLADAADADRAAFMAQALPEMAELMRERGAAVVLDLRRVLLAAGNSDITADLVERVDAQVGAGPAGGTQSGQPAPVQDNAPQAGGVPAQEDEPAASDDRADGAPAVEPQVNGGGLVRDATPPADPQAEVGTD